MIKVEIKMLLNDLTPSIEKKIFFLGILILKKKCFGHKTDRGSVEINTSC
ncbi:MAG: hypothetical protein FWC34_10935 [Bacteroidetes bacterium]|nr:hypothetical protein [Bacteroidota bacterium]